MAGCSSQLKRAALAGVAAVLVAVACSGRASPSAEPAEGSLPAGRDLEALSTESPTTTVPESVEAIASRTLPSTTVPAEVAAPCTTAPPVIEEESGDEATVVDNQDGTFLLKALPAFVPPRNDLPNDQVAPSNACKCTEELDRPQDWYVPPTLQQLRSGHTRAEVDALERNVSNVMTSFEAFFALDAPGWRARSQEDVFVEARETWRVLYGWSPDQVTQLREAGFCNTGVERQVDITDLAAAFADAYASGLRHFNTTAFAWQGNFADPFLTYAAEVEFDPLHDWIELVRGLASQVESTSAIGLLAPWTELVLAKQCHDSFNFPGTAVLSELYAAALTSQPWAYDYDEAAVTAIRRTGYSVEEFNGILYSCVDARRWYDVPMPFDFGPVGRLLADEIYVLLDAEFDTIVRAAPGNLTVTRNGKSDRQVGLSQCLATESLPELTFTSSHGAAEYPSYVLDHTTDQGELWLDEFRSLGAEYFSAAEAVQRLELPSYWDDLSGSHQREREQQEKDDLLARSRLLARLASDGYCNEGVTRELSVSDFARGMAFEVARAEMKRLPGVYLHAYGSAPLFYAAHSEEDPLHELVNELAQHLLDSRTTLPEWNYFKWPQLSAIRHCLAFQDIEDEGVTAVYLNSLLGTSPSDIELSDVEVEVIRGSGNTVGDFHASIKYCYLTHAAGEFDPPWTFPHGVEFLIAYFAAEFEPRIEAWLSANGEIVPDGLVIVE